ncbi:hypothetical protein [Yunchengibacter salinarum]|uniref:hypothetical protein n=1 Tax=Yunchengibacter salinarum TaxID=3133399 RepID=UPI0035B6441A
MADAGRKQAGGMWNRGWCRAGARRSVPLAVRALLVAALIAAAPILATGPGSAPAAAQDVSEKIDRLERQLRAVQRRVFSDGDMAKQSAQESEGAASTEGITDSRRLMADLSVKVSALESKLRGLTGRLETVEHRQKQILERLDRLTREVRIRFDEIKAGDGTAPGESDQGSGSASAPEAETTDAADADDEAGTEIPDDAEETVAPVKLPDGDVEAQYSYAFDFVRRNELDKGVEALGQFIEAHGSHTLGGNAKYWLGRVHMRRREPAQAARQLLSVIEDHTDHDKHPDALVELAAALVALDSPEDACNALIEFRDHEDSASPRLGNRAERLRKEAGCDG